MAQHCCASSHLQWEHEQAFGAGKQLEGKLQRAWVVFLCSSPNTWFRAIPLLLQASWSHSSRLDTNIVTTTTKTRQTPFPAFGRGGWIPVEDMIHSSYHGKWPEMSVSVHVLWAMTPAGTSPASLTRLGLMKLVPPSFEGLHCAAEKKNNYPINKPAPSRTRRQSEWSQAFPMLICIHFVRFAHWGQIE